MLAKAIRKNMKKAHSRLVDKIDSYGVNFKRGAVTSDDFSDAMCPFLDATEELLRKKGDELTKLRLAYDLVIELKDLSQYDVDMCVSYDDRSSDEPADELLRDIIRRRKEAGDTCDWGGDLVSLDTEGKLNGQQGLNLSFRSPLRLFLPSLLAMLLLGGRG